MAKTNKAELMDYGFVKPKTFQWDPLEGDYGRLVIEPLERGYGWTIGNSLRRALLSSIPGVAPFAIEVDGVSHEFQAVPGVVEDMVEIVLNLKEVRFALKGKEEEYKEEIFEARLSVKSGSGTREVRAGDIEVSPPLEVVNKGVYLFTLEENSSFNMRMLLRLGRGFSGFEENRRLMEELGLSKTLIPIDSLFSPVERVRYSVEATRVGRMMDYDRLVLEVWTDGRVSPEDAVRRASHILAVHFNLIGSFGESEEEDESAPDIFKVQKKIEETGSDLKEALSKPLEELELSARAINCLKEAGIETIGQLVTKTEEELLNVRNFGAKSLNEVKERLEQFNPRLHLGMKIEDL